jgi:hypothetical protein
VPAQAATYAVTVNPLVNWIWFGFGVMAIGSIIALLPESAFAFATARFPAGAATTSMLLLALVIPAQARAQGASQVPDVASKVPVVEKSPLRKQLEGEIMCMCGCRAPMNDCPMGPTCHGLQEQNAKLDKYLAEGMDRDAVRAAFVRDYGSQAVLAAPIDKGFNRLAWLLPYLLGATGAGLAGLVAYRWSKREADAGRADTVRSTQVDPALQARLEDELRDLD